MSYPPTDPDGSAQPGVPTGPDAPQPPAYPGPPVPAQPSYSPGTAAVPGPPTAPIYPAGGYPSTGYPAPVDPYAAQAAYPTQAGPASAPPFGAPMSAPPSSPPPTSGPPMSGPPYGSGYLPSPVPSGGAAKRGQSVLALAIVAALLFVLGGVMTGLYVAKSGELNRTERKLTAQVADRDATIDANTKQIEELKRSLESANDKVKSVEQDLTGTKNDRDEVARQKQVIAKCLDKLTTALAAASAGNRTAYNNAMKDLDKVCNEADKYL